MNTPKNPNADAQNAADKADRKIRLNLFSRVVAIVRRRLTTLDLARRYFGASYPAPEGFNEIRVREFLAQFDP
jgi:hypothetical protein